MAWLALFLVTFCGSAAAIQNNTTTQGPSLSGDDTGTTRFHPSTFVKIETSHDVMFTQDVLSEDPAVSEADCGSQCVGAAGCVMFTFHRGHNFPSGTCHFYKQYQSLLLEKEMNYGARSYALIQDMAEIECLQSGHWLQSGRCIRVLSEKLSYRHETQRCRELDSGHLLFTKTPDVLQFGIKLAQDYGITKGVWVGADILGGRREHMWADGTTLAFTSPLWAHDEPNNLLGNQNCVFLSMKMMQLDDLQCGLLQNVVCQRDM